MKINFANWILNQYGHLEKNAFCDEKYTLTYRQLSSRVKTLSSKLRDFGILPGDVVIICMEDCVDWPVAWLSCIYSGAVPMPASTVIGLDLLNDISTFVNCKLFLTGDDLTSKINFVPQDAVWNRTKLASLWNNPCDSDAVMVDPDSTGYMAMSSGSTGRPKVACYRHKVFFDIVKNIPQKLYGMTQDSVMMSIPKMSWGYGLHNSITYTLGVGATSAVLTSVPAPTAIFNFLEQVQPTIVASSPMIISKLVKDVYKDRRLPDSIKFFSSSGEDLPASLYEKFYSRFGIELNTAIGLLEVANICYAGTCGVPAKQTVGKSLPGVTIQIRNNHGKECQLNEVGEIYISSSMTAYGYLNLPKKSAETFVNGWVKTGDLGYINKDNNLVFVGRVDDVFKVNDLIISPVEIESKILQYRGIDQVAVAGVTTSTSKEVHAWVVVNTNQFDEETFKAWLLNNLFPHQIPKKLHYVKSIDETITNKQDRKSLVNKLMSLC